MQKHEPKVSIIIPVYNGANFLKAAIESAINQTYKNIEIIVVNDGSNDNGATEQITKLFGNKIRYFDKKNGGVSTALNFAIEVMTGDYFSWLSHDDLYLHNKIEKQIQFLQNNTRGDQVILYSDYQIIDENDLVIGHRILDTKLLNAKPEYSLLNYAINGITLLIPKKAFEVCGVFSEELSCTQDYDLWFRMQSRFKFIHLPLVLAKSRVHPNQDTFTNPNVVEEGNALWLKLIESVSSERKIELEGSEFNYYKAMAEVLKTLPYTKAFTYCIKKLNQFDSNRKWTYSDFKIDQPRRSPLLLPKKLVDSLTRDGARMTLQKINRFLIARKMKR